MYKCINGKRISLAFMGICSWRWKGRKKEMLLVTSWIRHGNISHVPQLLEAPCLSCISVTVAAFVPQVHNPNQSIPTKKHADCDWWLVSRIHQNVLSVGFVLTFVIHLICRTLKPWVPVRRSEPPCGAPPRRRLSASSSSFAWKLVAMLKGSSKPPMVFCKWRKKGHWLHVHWKTRLHKWDMY